MTEPELPWKNSYREFDPVESLIVSFKSDPESEKLFIAVKYATEVVDEYFRQCMVDGKSVDSFERRPTDFRGMYFTGVRGLVIKCKERIEANVSWPDIEAKLKRENRVITLFQQSKLQVQEHLVFEAQFGFDMELTYDRLAVIRRLALGEDTNDPNTWIYRDLTTHEVVDPEAPFGDDWKQINNWLSAQH